MMSNLTQEDIVNLREVVDNQALLGHPMTLVPNDVLVRLLDRVGEPSDEEMELRIGTALFRVAAAAGGWGTFKTSGDFARALWPAIKAELGR